jgi:hypothetical protein
MNWKAQAGIGPGVIGTTVRHLHGRKTSVRPVSGQILKTRIFCIQRISTEYST